MIFTDYQAVLDGRKTQTRRIKDACERLILVGDKKTVVGHYGRIKWQVGRTYAIEAGKFKRARTVGRFTLVDIREERVQCIKELDAEAEMGWRVPIRHFMWGVTTRLKFAKLWDDIWKYRPEWQWEANPEVFVLVMEV